LQLSMSKHFSVARVFCATAEESCETSAAAYGGGGFGSLAPGPSHSTNLGRSATRFCSNGAHEEKTSNNQLQQAHLQAERQRQQQQLRQQHWMRHKAAQQLAHMQQLVYTAAAVAAQAAHCQLAQHPAGHGMLTPPAQLNLQCNGSLPAAATQHSRQI
jgi:hypothetical protein